MARVLIVDAPGGGYVGRPDIETRVLGLEHEVRLTLVAESDAATVRSATAGADYLILWHHVALDADFFAQDAAGPAVVCASVGYDHVDVAAAQRRGVPVFHVPHYGTEEVADHALALLLALCRRLPGLRSEVEAGGWDWRAMGSASRLRGMVLGLIGLGRIGMAVARRAQAFGMDVVFYDPHNAPGIEKSLGLKRIPDLAGLLEIADAVSVHVPLTAETDHLLGPAEFGRMKAGSILINTARGGVVDLEALKEALSRGRPSWVGLDVVEGEPHIPAWLRADPRVLLTPHAAFYSDESLAELRTRAAEAVLHLAAGLPVTSAVRVV